MTSSRPAPKRPDPVSRRDFLRFGSLSVVGLTVAQQAAIARQSSFNGRSCIFLMMTGGPSQLDTFDPKPSAPVEIRGSARSISTAVPGVAISENLPRIAQRMGRLTLVRSLYHDAAPIHETGYQLLQTGRLTRRELRFPAFGSVVARTFGSRRSLPGCRLPVTTDRPCPPFVILNRPLSGTGVETYRGQGAGMLDADWAPVSLSAGEGGMLTNDHLTQAAEAEPDAVCQLYGSSELGEKLLRARLLVEAGARCVVVNQFDSLSEGGVTWDAHGRQPSGGSSLIDHATVLCPEFDRAFSALCDDLSQRGLDRDTLVVATGEFGRTPRVNSWGGRDHWPGAWSAVLFGGGVKGGAVVGSTDATGSAPREQPVHAAELVASIYQVFGLASDIPLVTAGALPETTLSDRTPIAGLFV